jgi:hypothetical protein
VSIPINREAAQKAFQYRNREESTMSAATETKTVKQVCKCEKCGSEAEMVVTCSLESAEAQQAAAPDAEPQASEHHKVKGHGVCSHCGNEADIWVDI